MKMLWAVGYPANRTAVRWVSDVLLTAIAGASMVPVLFHDQVHLRWAALLVLALTAAPLLVRRIWPLPVFALVLAAAACAGLWTDYAVDGAALLVALYTVASMRPRRDALACAAVLEVAGVIGLLRYAGRLWWFDAIFLSGMFAAALGLGLYYAARRAYLAELHDRAKRLEREWDQQAALAAAAERARIAREIHDIIAHNLTIMTTLAEAAIATSRTSPAQATEVMRSVAATGRRALADTRRVLGVLREQPGEGGGAREPVPDLAQLDMLIEQVRSAGLDTTIEISGEAPDMPAGVQLAVYRLVQEALTNTLKHGGPDARASVCLHFLPGELRVIVADDGSAGGAPAGAGGGLQGMRERIRAYGGDVRAGPRQPVGWAVSARVPLEDEGTT
jgi:signal transduction histidine kinase